VTRFDHHRPFLVLWVLAVTASVAAFVLHLALRGRVMSLGYELGRARAEQARLREVRRVLELEVASYQTPQRVEVVGRTLLGMTPPSPERIFPMSAAGTSSATTPLPALSASVGVGVGGLPAPGVSGSASPGAPPIVTAPVGPSIALPKTAALPGEAGNP
jgi:cell division protein FtsL